MKCSKDGCNKEASFQKPFYKNHKKGVIVDFYEYRCAEHMIYDRGEIAKWSKEVIEKKKHRKK